MGNSLKDQCKLEEAIHAYSKAISIKPDYAVAHNNMGNALSDQGNLGEAIQATIEQFRTTLTMLMLTTIKAMFQTPR